MIYLLGLSWWWLRDVLVPGAVAGGIACLVWWLLATRLGRGRPQLRRRGFVVLGITALAWLVIGSWQVKVRFEQPQWQMFRSYVADPIPAEVQDLAVDSGAPAMFFDGALLRFRAPAAIRQAILSHALPGAAIPQLAARIAAERDRNPRVMSRICNAQGGYLPYDPWTFSGYDNEHWAFVIRQIAPGGEQARLPPVPADHDLFVYAERGDWGTLSCIAKVDRESGEMRLCIVPTPAAPRR